VRAVATSGNAGCNDAIVIANRATPVLAACAVLAGSLSAAPAHGASAPGASASRATRPMVAPYLDMGARQPANLYAAIRRRHLRYFSAGFVIGRGCTATWDDGVPVSRDPAVTGVVRKAHALGAHVVVSFGGQGGDDLSRTCPDPTAALAAYRSVIARLHSKYADFDIEGDALGDHTAMTARFHAIASLERQLPRLRVSLTIAVLPHGLDAQGRRLIRQARSDGARVDLVNIMAMDYGGGSIDMGRAAISAARATRRQLRAVWPHSTYANLGITPMIGRNDDLRETFTLADARSVRAFARSHHVGRLAFWAIGRDKRCATPSRRAKSNCSSVAQSRLAFTRAFLG
jgi:hypothetical protein